MKYLQEEFILTEKFHKLHFSKFHHYKGNHELHCMCYKDLRKRRTQKSGKKVIMS